MAAILSRPFWVSQIKETWQDRHVCQISLKSKKRHWKVLQSSALWRPFCHAHFECGQTASFVEIWARLGTQNAVMKFLHFGGHLPTPGLSTALALWYFFVGHDVLHNSTDFRLPTTNFTTLVAIGTWRLAAILPRPFWGRAKNKNDLGVSPGHTCVPNLIGTRARLGTQNAVTHAPTHPHTHAQPGYRSMLPPLKKVFLIMINITGL